MKTNQSLFVLPSSPPPPKKVGFAVTTQETGLVGSYIWVLVSATLVNILFTSQTFNELLEERKRNRTGQSS